MHPSQHTWPTTCTADPAYVASSALFTTATGVFGLDAVACGCAFTIRAASAWVSCGCQGGGVMNTQGYVGVMMVVDDSGKPIIVGHTTSQEQHFVVE